MVAVKAPPLSASLVQVLAAAEQTIRIAGRSCRLFPFAITREPGHRTPPPAVAARQVHDTAAERIETLSRTLPTHGLVLRRAATEEDGRAIPGRECSQALLRDSAADWPLAGPDAACARFTHSVAGTLAELWHWPSPESTPGTPAPVLGQAEVQQGLAHGPDGDRLGIPELHGPGQGTWRMRCDLHPGSTLLAALPTGGLLSVQGPFETCTVVATRPLWVRLHAPMGRAVQEMAAGRRAPVSIDIQGVQGQAWVARRGRLAREGLRQTGATSEAGAAAAATASPPRRAGSAGSEATVRLTGLESAVGPRAAVYSLLFMGGYRRLRRRSWRASRANSPRRRSGTLLKRLSGTWGWPCRPPSPVPSAGGSSGT